MNIMNGSRLTTLATATVVATLLTTSGCGFRDRAGGAAGEATTVLTFAQAIDGAPPAQLAAWVDEVSRLSDRSLKIKFENGYRLGQADVEAAEIRDVRAGKVDMGWVGARALHQEGVTSFDALIAPLLVDSHDLQARVFEAGIAQDMLAAAGDSHGARAIGVLPGPMRKLLGIDHAFVAPADFRGTDIGMQDSAVAKATFAALGATSTPLPSGAKDLTHVDAYEQQLSSIWGNQYQTSAHYLTANVDLWPRPLVVMVNDNTYDGLSADQKSALRKAGPASIGAAIDASRTEDADSVENLCGSALTIVDATTADLTALQKAVAPVFRQLRGDAKTATWVDRITALKRQVGAPPDTFRCAAGSGTSAAGPLPDGTYRTTLTRADAKAGCKPGEPGADALLAGPQVDHVLELQVKGRQLVQTGYPVGHPEQRDNGWHGTYRTFRHTLQLIEDGVATPQSATFTFDGKQLVLRDLRPAECDGRTVWTSNPWTLVDRARAGSNLEGTWTTTITAADDKQPGDPKGRFVMTFKDGHLQLTEPSGEVGFYGDYTAFRDRLQVTGGPDVIRADFRVDGDTLTFTHLSGPGCGDCRPYAVVWESHPWHRQ
jgi:TRAP-type C4-dicarboxylate transport system substrate-binding protein